MHRKIVKSLRIMAYQRISIVSDGRTDGVPQCVFAGNPGGLRYGSVCQCVGARTFLHRAAAQNTHGSSLNLTHERRQMQAVKRSGHGSGAESRTVAFVVVSSVTMSRQGNKSNDGRDPITTPDT